MARTFDTTGKQVSGATNMGCLVVFGGIFFLAGALVIEQSIFGKVQAGARLGMAGMGLLFALVGGGIIAAGVYGMRSARRVGAAQAAHPNEPWRWRGEWSAWTISDSSNVSAIGSWVIAIIWNAIAWTATFAVLHPTAPAAAIAPTPAPAVRPAQVAPRVSSSAATRPERVRVNPRNLRNPRNPRSATQRAEAPISNRPTPSPAPNAAAVVAKPAVKPAATAKSDPKRYLILIFPAIGIALLASAIYFTLRRLRFGRSLLTLETRPGCIGGWLAGTIDSRGPVFAEAVQLELQCVRRVTTGSGKNRSTWDTTLWEDLQVLAGRLPMGKLGGSAIPLSFRIPASAHATEKPDSNTEVFWQLRAHASMEGPDYVAEFKVPVFHAQATQGAGFVPAAEPVAAKMRTGTPSQSRRGDDSSIGFTLGPGNRKRFVFPGGRNPAADLMITIFGLIFGGIGLGVFLFVPDTVPRYLFGISFGLMCGLPCTIGGLVMWFRRVEIQFDPHGLERHWHMLGISRVRTLSAGEVDQVSYETHMSVGNTAFYTVYANLKEGKKVALASSLRERDAKWVAGEISQSLGRPAPGDATPPVLPPGLTET